MSHHIYQTKGYIIDSVESGEANSRLTVLTEDLGLIVVAAQGVRKINSKLSASIQNLSYSKLSVVRGKEVWRLTNAEKMISLFDRRLPISVRRLLIQSLSFVNRLTPQDIKMPEIFSLVSKLSTFCFGNKDTANTHIAPLRLLFQLRILSYLGYGSSDPVLTKITQSDDFNVGDISYVNEFYKVLQEHVDKALEQSHL